MPGPLIQAVLLIVDSLAGFFSTLLLLRFFMQAFRVPFGNPVGDFVLRLTGWLVLPLRRFMPSVSGYDIASLAGAYLLQVLFLAVAILLHSGPESFGTGTALLILSRGALAVVRIAIYLVIGLLVAQAVLSWINPYSPLRAPIARITDPLLRPLRRIIPPISNIDLTPLIAILLAQVILIFL